jgi:hypothetical protein
MRRTARRCAGPDFDGSVRPGDNLYTSSVVAFDPDDGSLKWHYQWTPHDVWDYDGVNENILFEEGGRKLLGHFDKNGYFFVIDRTNGRFVRATKFARATWGDIDSSTGRVTPRITPTPAGAAICPGPAGAKEWPHASYSRATHLFYTPVVETCGTFKLLPQQFKEGMAYWSGEVTPDKEEWGHVKAAVAHRFLLVISTSRDMVQRLSLRSPGKYDPLVLLAWKESGKVASGCSGDPVKPCFLKHFGILPNAADRRAVFFSPHFTVSTFPHATHHEAAEGGQAPEAWDFRLVLSSRQN